LLLNDVFGHVRRRPPKLDPPETTMPLVPPRYGASVCHHQFDGPVGMLPTF
jgi:hypothetical protein